MSSVEGGEIWMSTVEGGNKSQKWGEEGEGWKEGEVGLEILFCR